MGALKETYDKRRFKSHESKDKIARGLVKQGQRERAVVLFQENLAWSMDNLGQDHAVTVCDQETLAFTLNELKEYDKAKDLDKKALETRLRIEGLSPPSKGFLKTQKNLANDYFGLNDIRQAAAIYEENYYHRRQHLGKDDKATLWVGHDLATCWRKLGDFKKAQDLHQKILDARIRIKTSEIDIIRSRQSLALDQFELGWFNQAQKLNEKNVEALKSTVSDPGLLAASEGALTRCIKALEEKKRRERTENEVQEKAEKAAQDKLTTATSQPVPKEDRSGRPKTAGDGQTDAGNKNDGTLPPISTTTAAQSSPGITRPRSLSHDRDKPSTSSHPRPAYGDGEQRELPSIPSNKMPPDTPSYGPLLSKPQMYLPISDYEEDRIEPDSVFDSRVMSAPPSKASHARYFLQMLKEINGLLKSGFSSGRRFGLPAVKVAILDTGIHEQHPLRRKLAGYHDFVEEHYTEGETLFLFTKDNTGHGSDMVDLLYKTAPCVSIYVARVFQNNTGDASTAMHVAKAIAHARDKWKVDIISMSFGFEEEDPRITEAIKESKDLLMFAASSNYGVRFDFPIMFPARMVNKVICINAADGIGHPYEANPHVDATRNLSILGVDVPLRKRIDPNSAEPQPRYGTGTSMATPIAAGVAALVLEFARQDGMHTKVEDPTGELKTHTGMSAVLRSMAQIKDRFAFIVPEKVLLPDRKKKKNLSGLERMSEACRMISGALKNRYAYT